MATTETVARAAHNTLAGTAVDTITFTDRDFHAVEVANRDAAGGTTIYFTTDGSTPSAAGDDCDFVAPGEAVVVRPRGRVVKVIGNGNAYSICVVDE